ncbi:MAG: DUF6675 family protein, partial [Treponemataceae bacterium]
MKVKFLFCVLFFFGGAIFAQNVLETILPENIVKKLYEKEKLEIISYNEDDFSLTLVPKTKIGKEIQTSWEKSTKPLFVVESLYLLPKKKIDSSKTDIEHVSQIMRSISLLTQAQYYSNGHKKMRDLYEESYVIADKKTKEKIPDPIEGNADGLQLTAIQKDST